MSHPKNQPLEPLVLAPCTPAGQADSSTPVALGFSTVHVFVTFLVMRFCPSLLIHLCVPKAWFLFVEETACLWRRNSTRESVSAEEKWPRCGLRGA